VPIDRRADHGSVGEAIDYFKRYDKFALAITPEGTRARVERWKSGFYHIATAAEVPIVPLTFDYGPKEIRFWKPFKPTGDMENDIQELKGVFKNVRAKNPQNFAP
jgi:1-acyl-sn-glycerol-3-phosphate acyltransferase